MKKIIPLILFLSIYGCGGTSTEAYTDSAVAIIDTANTQSSSKAESPINPIIGNTYKIGNIEVAEKDFPNKMNWQSAKDACESLGNGWRLPTKDELNLLYQNKDKISGFTTIEYSYYWSSDVYDGVYRVNQDFDNGGQYNDREHNPFYVRAVRAF